MVLLELFIVLIKHNLFFDAAFNFKKLNKMSKIILVSIFEIKIFSHTCKDNTILKTLKEALKKGVNLGYVDLSGANLINANFSGANFSGADLTNANFSGADLTNANFSHADLSGADLCRANLINANLSNADLTNANFSGANFRDADLCNADLCNADLRNVNLCRANLINANLSNADLSGADLTNAKITDTKLPIYSKWGFSIENESLNIGCKTKTFSEWKEWFEKSEEEFSTERNTEDFKRIQAMFYAYEAYYNFLKS